MTGETYWIEFLPGELVAKGRRVGDELAWIEPDAIRVLEHLSTAGCRILGVDTWSFDSPSAPGPTVLGWDWDAARDQIGAREFVVTFKNRPHPSLDLRSLVIWFNFTAHEPIKAAT